MLSRWGLRRRIVATSQLIVLVVMVILGVVVARGVNAAISTTTYQSALDSLGDLATDLAAEPAASAVHARATEGQGTRFRQVLDESGAVLVASSDMGREPVLRPGELTAPVGEATVLRRASLPGVLDEPVIIAASKVQGVQGQVLTAVVVEPAALLRSAGTRLLALGLAGLAAALVILGLVLSYAVRQALDPVDRMRADLARITSSRQNRSVSSPRADDEIGRLGAAINDLLDRLRRSEEQRAAFVSDAGHELRSPLTTVGLSIESLGADLDAEQRRVVSERAMTEIVRLRSLVNDLLALAAADEHAGALREEDVDLDDVVLQEVAVARAKGASVDVRVEPARVLGASEQVVRVVRNLMDNAVRHRRSAIRVVVAREGNDAVLTVDNDGPVIPVPDRERVFERFVRLDDARDRDSGGSGLGLAIVRQLVRAHGGRVAATESADGWCRFEVRLPTAS